MKKPPPVCAGGAFFYLASMFQRDTVFLIDGYALIYRAFFAMIGRPLTTSKGENTSVAWGVANFLLRLFENHNPGYLGWIHDAGDSFRKEKFPQYKATREKLDDELQEVFDNSLLRVEELLKAFGIPLISVDGYEADDVIGTLATMAESQGRDVVIVSGDKDFYQLISERVSLLNPGRRGPAAIGEQIVTIENASERLGVAPEFVIDYLGLVGDSSDNIPGVRGIGAKTAQVLINTYGNIESIIAHASEIKGKRPREALLAHPEDARLSRELVTIIKDVPMDVTLSDLELGAPDSDLLVELLAELEFHSLVKKVLGTREASPEVASVPSNVVTTPGELSELVSEVCKAGSFAFTVESDRQNPRTDKIAGLSVAVSPDRSWYLPLNHTGHDKNLPPLDSSEMSGIANLFRDRSIRKIGHETKRDWHALKSADIEIDEVSYDLLIASFLAEPGRRSYDVNVLALECLGKEINSRESVVGKGKGEVAFVDVPVSTAAAYSCARTEMVLVLKEYFAERLMDFSLQSLFNDVEMPLTKVLVEMEAAGIGINLDALAELSTSFSAELEKLEKEIYEEAGTEFNINSTPQLRHILFEKLQLPVLKKTKTGPSTDASVLTQLADTGFSLPIILLEYRELTKLRSTYVDALPGAVDTATGRIHTTFNQIGAATGRLSSHDPNLQNIPVRTARGEMIRRCFVPAEGMTFVVADYSQVELRLLAHLSQDRLLVEAFNRGGDIHRETASVVFDTPLDEVNGEMRDRAKTINFATLYGQGAFSLSNQLGITKQEAKDFIDLYFERFSGVRRFLDHQIELARSNGYVETIFGRRRNIPELKDSNYNIRAFGERLAMNSPIQGSAADLIKIAMVRLAETLRTGGWRAKILLQVHDELVLECPSAEVEGMEGLLKEAMEGAAELSVPLVVDVGVGLNWLDAKA